MSTVEARLTAALEARAALVRPEDLRPTEVPVAPPASRLPRPVVYAAAAAACAAVLAVPLVLGSGGGEQPSPAPPMTTTTPPTDGGTAAPAVPAFFPEATAQAQLGESFDVPLGDGTVTVDLVGTARNGTVGEGDAEVVLTLPDGVVRRLAVAPGWQPAVHTDPVVLAGADLALLLVQEGGDNTSMSLLVLRGDDLDVARTDEAVPFGNGFVGPGAQYRRTWIAPDGTLRSAVPTEDLPLGSEPRPERQAVYRWVLRGTAGDGGTPVLRPLDEGCFTFEVGAGPIAVARC